MALSQNPSIYVLIYNKMWNYLVYALSPDIFFIDKRGFIFWMSCTFGSIGVV